MQAPGGREGFDTSRLPGAPQLSEAPRRARPDRDGQQAAPGCRALAQRLAGRRQRGMIGLVNTVVAFHAHPDDEVLLTGGTLAKLAAGGRRVVIVVATDGSTGKASDRRLREMRASAQVLGAARV